MRQLSLFDPDGGERGKKDGIKRGFRNANPEWIQAALESVEKAARKLPDLTTDEAEQEMPRHVWTHDKRAWAGVMKVAAKAGFIRKTEEWRKSKIPICHVRDKRVWKSLIMWTQ